MSSNGLEEERSNLIPEVSPKKSTFSSTSVHVSTPCIEQSDILLYSRSNYAAYAPTESKLVVKNVPSEAMSTLQSNGDAEENMVTQETASPNQSSQVNKEPAVNRSQFTCVCGENFEKSVQIAAHKRWTCQMKEKVAQCNICETWFASDIGLRRHMKLAHGGAFSCDKCSLRFHTKKILTRHWMEAHFIDDGTCQLKCHVCESEGFKSRYDLEVHLIGHKYKRHQKEKSCSDFSTVNAGVTVSQESTTNTSHTAPSHFGSPSYHAPYPFHHPQRPLWNRFHCKPRPSFSAFDFQKTSEQLNSHNLNIPAPRHDHILPEQFEHYRHNHHLIYKHGYKMRWKKYLKLLQAGKLTYDLNCRGALQQKESNSSDYNAITCEYCNQSIGVNKLTRHYRKDCPSLDLHKCCYCDRIFKKRHFLIKHMQEHYLPSKGQVSVTEAESSIASSSLVQLQQRLSSNLNLKDSNSILSYQDSAISLTSLDVSRSEEADCVNQKILEGKGVQYEISAQTNKNHICAVCGIYFDTRSKDMLIFHLKEHIHQVLTVQKVQEWAQKSSDYFFGDKDAQVDESSSTCDLNSEVASLSLTNTTTDGSSNFSSLESHVPKSNISFSGARLEAKPLRHEKGEVNLCHFCSKTFSFKKDLKSHMKQQHKDQMLECPVCHKQFSGQKRGKFYERHMNSHYGVKVFKYKCEECGKTFLEGSKLKSHMVVHNKEPLFKCSTCSKGYGNKSSLIRHERKHTGERPYKCEICLEGFMEKRELIRHSARHTGIAPFSCSVCSQGFTLKTSLMTHMKRKHALFSESTPTS